MFALDVKLSKKLYSSGSRREYTRPEIVYGDAYVPTCEKFEGE